MGHDRGAFFLRFPTPLCMYPPRSGPSDGDDGDTTNTMGLSNVLHCMHTFESSMHMFISYEVMYAQLYILKVCMCMYYSVCINMYFSTSMSCMRVYVHVPK